VLVQDVAVLDDRSQGGSKSNAEVGRPCRSNFLGATVVVLAGLALLATFQVGTTFSIQLQDSTVVEHRVQQKSGARSSPKRVLTDNASPTLFATTDREGQDRSESGLDENNAQTTTVAREKSLAPQTADINRLPSTWVPRSDRLVICMISYGWDAKGYETNETIKGSRHSLPVALKGILSTIRKCQHLHFYFVTGLADEERIRSMLAPLKCAPVNVTFSFVPLNETQLDEWMSFIGHKASHRTGAAGNIKYFYPLLFPNEEKVLMLDSDILVGRDLSDLWSEFDRFTPTQLFALSPQWPTVHASKDNQFNAGVGLLHLQRMREADWLSLSKAAIRHWDQSGMTPKCCAHGDQSAFHMVRYYRPGALGLLPRWWNINKCHQYQQIHRKPKGSFVGIVHLGCCKMCTRAKIGPRWAALYDSISNISFANGNDAQVSFATNGSPHPGPTITCLAPVSEVPWS
jgi:hypothetical protein